MCFLAESREPASEPPAAEGPRLPRRRYRAELVEGRGYSTTLAIEAACRRDAVIEAALYAARHGYRLGRVNAAAADGHRS